MRRFPSPPLPGALREPQVTDTVTTQAFTTAEGEDIFEGAGKIVGSYKPMEPPKAT